MRRQKLYFTIQTLLVSLICLIQSLPAQNVSSASDAAHGWDAPLRRCWEFETAEMSDFPPQSDELLTIFQTLGDGTLLAIDAGSGKTVWRSQFGGEIVSNALFEDQKLYLINKITDETGTLFVFRSISAATCWKL